MAARLSEAAWFIAGRCVILPGMSDSAPTAAATCFDCGYALRGLRPDGRCPECGLAVAETLENLADLQRSRSVETVRRGTGWLLAGVGVAVLVFLIVIGVSWSVNDLDHAARRRSQAFLTGLFTAGSLALAVLAWRAADGLVRSPPPGPWLARRILSTAGWVIPSLTALFWLLAWLDPPRSIWWHGRARFELEAVGQALSLTLGAACATFFPAFLTETQRRLDPWPNWFSLGSWTWNGLRVAAGAMWIGLMLTLPALLDAAVWTAGRSPLFRRGRSVVGPYSAAELAQFAQGLGLLAYAAAVPVGLLFCALAYVAAGRLARQLSTPPAEEVGEERQLAAVLPQGVEVE